MTPNIAIDGIRMNLKCRTWQEILDTLRELIMNSSTNGFLDVTWVRNKMQWRVLKIVNKAISVFDAIVLNS